MVPYQPRVPGGARVVVPCALRLSAYAAALSRRLSTSVLCWTVIMWLTLATVSSVCRNVSHPSARATQYAVNLGRSNTSTVGPHDTPRREP